MSTPTLETIIAKLRELAEDSRNQIELAPPVTAGSMLWLTERFATKLEHPIPPDLAALLSAFDGCSIGAVTIFGSRGAHGMVDHNLELRLPGGKWTSNLIVIGTTGTGSAQQSVVLDAVSGQGHVSDLRQPRWVKSFPSLPALLVHLIRQELGVRARSL
jgi:hypothetical protein